MFVGYMKEGRGLHFYFYFFLIYGRVKYCFNILLECAVCIFIISQNMQFRCLVLITFEIPYIKLKTEIK